MATLEAGLVVGNAVCRQLVHDIHSLVADLAFLLGTQKCHGTQMRSKERPTSKQVEQQLLVAFKAQTQLDVSAPAAAKMKLGVGGR